PLATRDLLLAFVVVVTVPQANHVRPQLFSLMFFAWLMAALAAPARGWIVSVPIVAMVALWANMHGGRIVGAGTLAGAAVPGFFKSVGDAAFFASRGRRDRVFFGAADRERWSMLGTALAAMAATIVNPYGWRLWTFLGETVGLSRPDIADWQPVY